MVYIDEDYNFHEFEPVPNPWKNGYEGYYFDKNSYAYQRDFCAPDMPAAEKLRLELLDEDIKNERSALKNYHALLKRNPSDDQTARLRSDIKDAHNHLRELKAIQRRINGA